MAPRWPAIGLVVAMLGALCAPIGLAKGGDDTQSFKVVTGATFADLHDVHGDRLVWFQGVPARVDLVLHDLATADSHVLTSVAGQGSRPLRVQDVGFDGRWVVWCDDRFGNLEVFAFDTSSGSLVRVTEAGPDDAEAMVDSGRIAWSRSNQVWIHDLTNKTSWQVVGTGHASEPALTGETVAWVRLDEGERYVAASTLAGHDPRTIERVHGSFIHSLQAADGWLGWEAWTLRDPAAPVKGYLSTVVQVVRAEGGPVQNLTSLPVLDATTGTPLGLAVGEGHVAWFDVAARTIRVWQPTEMADVVSTIEYPGTSMALSNQYLVVSQISSEGGGNLAARPWTADDRRDPWLAPGPGVAAVVVACTLVAVARSRRR